MVGRSCGKRRGMATQMCAGTSLKRCGKACFPGGRGALPDGNGASPGGRGAFRSGIRAFPDGGGAFPERQGVFPDGGSAFPGRKEAFRSGRRGFRSVKGVFPDGKGVFRDLIRGFFLVPKLQLGNAPVREAPASSGERCRRKQKLPRQASSQAEAWKRGKKKSLGG